MLAYSGEVTAGVATFHWPFWLCVEENFFLVRVRGGGGGKTCPLLLCMPTRYDSSEFVDLSLGSKRGGEEERFSFGLAGIGGVRGWGC